MMIIMQFTFQIILLAIGFGVGYFLLFHASTQQGNLKTIGQALGGILIVMAMVLSVFSCYYSMKLSNKDYMQSGCPVQRVMDQPGNPIMKDEQPDENDQVQNSETESAIDAENTYGGQNKTRTEDRSIKSNIKDHE